MSIEIEDVLPRAPGYPAISSAHVLKGQLVLSFMTGAMVSIDTLRIDERLKFAGPRELNPVQVHATSLYWPTLEVRVELVPLLDRMLRA